MFRIVRQVVAYFTSRIRFKIIFPFALLTVIVAIAGIYLSTRLVSGTLEERFTRQLIDAGNAAADGLVQREQLHLSVLRAIAFTEGMDEAILAGDQDRLRTLLFPLVANYGVDRVDVVSTDGYQLLEIHRPPGSDAVEDYSTTSGANLQNWPVWPTVQKALSGMADSQGDKYVALSTINDESFFVTTGPVKQGDEVVGAIIVSSYTRGIVGSLNQTTFADVSLYDLEGQLIDTTLAGGEGASATLAIDPKDVHSFLSLDGTSSLRQAVSVSGREYDLLAGVFVARGEPLGFYSVALPTTFIDTYLTTNRTQMVLIFAIALLLVFGIGYAAANAITGRVQHLMVNAMAVANGDFTRRTQISSGDEIGMLARSLDHMTESLDNYTTALQNRIDELSALYESSTAVTVRSGLNLDHVLQAVTDSVQSAIRGADWVIVHLLDESGQMLVPRASTPNNADGFPSLTFESDGEMGRMLSAARPRVVGLADIEAHLADGSFSENGASFVLVAPLIAGQALLGMLTLIPNETHQQATFLNEDSERLLATLANQSAIAIKNAQLFEATQKAYEELRQLDDLKTQFINIAAHELRTPLGAMMGYASFSEKRAPPKLRKPMRFLVASSLRMRTMVDAMLAIQRLDAGKAFVRLSSLDLRDAIKKLVADYETMAELEGHTIDLNLPDDLPRIQADAEKVDLILSNLLSNAIKFTPERGHIEIGVQDQGEELLVSVSDTGVGIPPEDQARIFERFYQARAEHMAGHGGMGIGLTIVKNLVELHGGCVWVESVVGEGSTFSFTLPKVANAPSSVDFPFLTAGTQLQDEKELSVSAE